MLLRSGLRFALVLALVGGSGLAGGCAAAPTTTATKASTASCAPIIEVSPSSATANHALMSPGNQAQFFSEESGTCDNVIGPVYAAWSNPDPLDIQISSAADTTNGTAVCKGPTNGAVTLQATIVFANVTTIKNVSLTCQ